MAQGQTLIQNFGLQGPKVTPSFFLKFRVQRVSENCTNFEGRISLDQDQVPGSFPTSTEFWSASQQFFLFSSFRRVEIISVQVVSSLFETCAFFRKQQTTAFLLTTVRYYAGHVATEQKCVAH